LATVSLCAISSIVRTSQQPSDRADLQLFMLFITELQSQFIVLFWQITALQ